VRYYGASYYPEIFPREEWERDVRLMAETGMNVTRLAESAWTYMEPREAVFSFDWLDEAVDLCGRYGISVVLGTPTYMPPPWLVREHPGILPTAADGRRLGLGGRHHYCLNSEEYLEATRRIVGAMAERYGDHPNVIGWQIHNEFGLSTCFCERCERAWHRWLGERYATIEELNVAWGNDSWGRLYVDFEGIPLPSQKTDSPEGLHTLPLVLAHGRFRSDEFRKYQRTQLDVLRPRVGERFVTHNAMGMDLNYDHFGFFGDLDVSAWDNYPPIQGGWAGAAAAHDLYRNFKDRAHWAMEQICGTIGTSETAWAGQPRPGELSRWTLHSYAHGAEAVVYWHWRSKPGGNWPYWQGVLTPGGQTTRRQAELEALGRQLAALRELEDENLQDGAWGRGPAADVAVLVSYDNLWASRKDRGAPGFSNVEVLYDLYRPLVERGLGVDLVSPEADLSAYGLVVVPLLGLIDEEIPQRLTAYAGRGGTLLVAPRAGRYSWDGRLRPDPPPGPLSDVCGIEVGEYDVLLDGRKNGVRGDRLRAESRLWCDLIETKGAETLAVYTSGFYAGTPALTWNRYGRGGALYLGTYLHEEGYGDLLDIALERTGIRQAFTVPPGCEVQKRHGLTFVFNHTDANKTVEVPEGLVDALGGEPAAGRRDLTADGVLVLKDGP
jgi:beta-galactosidase